MQTTIPQPSSSSRPGLPAHCAGSLSHPAWPGRARYTLTRRPLNDELATAQTVAAIARYMTRDATHPRVRAAVAEALRHTPAEPAQEAAAVFDWIKAHVKFREDREPARPLAGLVDPETTEVLIRPADLLSMPDPAGDCDDHAMLAGAMLLNRGIEPELVTIAAEAAAPATYSHIYARARLSSGSLALDTSHGQAPGWEAPAAGKSRTWRLQEMTTLGAIDWGKLLTTAADTSASIFKARYGQPPAGVYQQTGPQGTVYYRQPADASALQFPGLQAGGGYTWILIAVGILAVVMVVGRRS